MLKNSLILFFLLTLTCLSQIGDDLYIYGTVQGIYLHEFSDQNNLLTSKSFSANPNNRTEQIENDFDNERSTFAIQQFDLFFNKYFNDRLNLFIDIEFSSNFDSKNDWGGLALRESWINYSVDDRFNIKAGLFFPSFNNLNEIKNRLNLINYIFRPIPYERLLKEVSNSEDFIPERAFLQFHGAIPINKFFVDYALYMGNSETSAISTNSEGIDYISGADQGNLEKKLYGARIGIRNKRETFKLGLSGTRDYNNGSNFISGLYLSGFDNQIPEESRQLEINDQLRYRIGADLNINIYDFTIEAEYSFSELEEFSFPNNDQISNIFNSLEAWNRFYYWTIHYDFTNKIFSYVGGSEISYEILGFISDADYLTLGGGYRASENLTLKAQYIIYHQNTNFVFPVLNDNGLRSLNTINSELTNNFFILGFTAHF